MPTLSKTSLIISLSKKKGLHKGPESNQTINCTSWARKVKDGTVKYQTQDYLSNNLTVIMDLLNWGLAPRAN